MSVLFLRVVRLCDAHGSGKLWLYCASVKVGKVECIHVRFEFVAGVRVVHCIVRLFCLGKEIKQIPIKSFTLILSVMYFCRSTARLVRAMSRGDDHGGDRARRNCAGVGEQRMVLYALVTRYVCGRPTGLVASARTPRREGGSALCEGVSVMDRGGQRR